MKEQEIIFKKRLHDLARTAYFKNRTVYTDFLNLNELHIVHSFQPEESDVTISFFGGYEEAERQIAAFIPDAFSFEADAFPISCIHITPVSAKFAEPLTHRDFLGAILHLGIDRSKIGDILVEEKQAYVFCHEQMASFLMENIYKIRHTNVQLELITEKERLPKPKMKEIHGTVASIRLDSMIALAFSNSRSSMMGLIEGGKVYVNGKMTTSNGHPLKPGDIVSVRGYGKFRYDSANGNTRKGRISVSVSLYV